MKYQILFLILATSSIGCREQSLSKMPYSEFIVLAQQNKLPDPSEVKLFDPSGNEISEEELKELLRTLDHIEVPYVNANGIIKEIHFEPKPPLKTVSIDCDHRKAILDSIYIVDQTEREKFNPLSDYSNLEHVVSIIETCGMPDEYDVLKTIFFVIQHNHSKYQKKYIDQLKAKAEEGKLSRSKVAMMEDRILLSDGKPQIYGTQVITKDKGETWTLYDLMEPEKVNQRRGEVGLGMIESYLENFGIEFSVEQQ